VVVVVVVVVVSDAGRGTRGLRAVSKIPFITTAIFRGEAHTTARTHTADIHTDTRRINSNHKHPIVHRGEGGAGYLRLGYRTAPHQCLALAGLAWPKARCAAPLAFPAPVHSSFVNGSSLCT